MSGSRVTASIVGAAMFRGLDDRGGDRGVRVGGAFGAIEADGSSAGRSPRRGPTGRATSSAENGK
jgi:hypothetical protein